MYDRECSGCGKVTLDHLEPVTPPDHPCAACGAPTARCWTQKANNVIGDEVDIWIENGLCHDDGRPRHFTSRQEIYREAARKGLTNVVEHVTGKTGTDKNPNTSRWFSLLLPFFALYAL